MTKLQPAGPLSYELAQLLPPLAEFRDFISKIAYIRINDGKLLPCRTAKCIFLMHNIINAMARDWILPLHACTLRTAQQYQYACMCMLLIASAES